MKASMHEPLGFGKQSRVLGIGGHDGSQFKLAKLLS